MNILTSNAHFRQRVVKKSYKVGVTAAAKYYRISRQAIYEWRNKYDGKSWKSLMDKSHRPHHHPNEHTPKEKEMILRRYPRYKDDMIGQLIFQFKFYRFTNRLNIHTHLKTSVIANNYRLKVG